MFPARPVSPRLAGHRAPDAKLAATILARAHAERGVVTSNQGGRHSAEYASWRGPAGHAVPEKRHGRWSSP